MQKAFFNQIVNDVIYMALEPRMTNTTTFKDLLRLAKENFNTITSHFDNIQCWLSMTRLKDEPELTYMERVRVSGKRMKVGNVSEDQWIVHHFHKNLSLQSMKEIRTYLNPGVDLDNATSRQVIDACVKKEMLSREMWRSHNRANKVDKDDKKGGGKGRRNLEDVECYCCRETRHIAPKCGIKREDAVCTYSNCSSPNGHLLKACKTRKEEQGNKKKKKKKGKNKEKSKKVESEDEQEETEDSPEGGDSSEN